MAFTIYRGFDANGVSSTRATILTNTAKAYTLRGMNIINHNLYPVFLKFWDVTASSAGTSNIMSTIEIPAASNVPATGAVYPGNRYIPFVSANTLEYFKLQTGNNAYFTVAATQFEADTDTTAIGVNLSVEFYYELT